MHLLSLLLNPGVIGVMALFLSVIWMLRDEKDKTRPLLVFALILNLFFGFLLTVFMSREGGLLPWKYDYVLFALDRALGVTAAPIARSLQGVFRIPLFVVYQLMVPMMIAWFLVTEYSKVRGSVVLAYVGELVVGPLLYAVLPGCGPIYAFGAHWLNPPQVQAETVRLAAMPNAFPSLHIGTAFVFVLFAPGRFWQAVSLAFLFGTGLATLATGEHYVIDLVAGLAFGCFAACVGYRRFRSAITYLAVVACWTLTVRFAYPLLIAHPGLLRLMAVLTIGMAVHAVFKVWRTPALCRTEQNQQASHAASVAE
ncbi:MAG: phosphatase PAP2 family protein [Terracidiphilus sp.]